MRSARPVISRAREKRDFLNRKMWFFESQFMRTHRWPLGLILSSTDSTTFLSSTDSTTILSSTTDSTDLFGSCRSCPFLSPCCAILISFPHAISTSFSTLCNTDLFCFFTTLSSNFFHKGHFLSSSLVFRFWPSWLFSLLPLPLSLPSFSSFSLPLSVPCTSDLFRFFIIRVLLFGPFR